MIQWNLASRTSLIGFLQILLSQHVLLSLIILVLIEPFPIIIFNLDLTPIAVFHRISWLLSPVFHRFFRPKMASKSVKLTLGGAGKKKVVHQNILAGFEEEDSNRVVRENISSINGMSIVSSEIQPAGSAVPELVIPLIQKSQQNRSIEEEAEMRVLEKMNQKSSNVVSSDTSDELTIGVSSNNSQGGERKNAPMLIANMNPELLGDLNDDERFKMDISKRANDISAHSGYHSVPIEKFGAALLRGMGWGGPSEADKIQAKTYDKVLSSREPRLGLGAQIKPPDKDTRGSKEKKQKATDDWAKKAKSEMMSQSLKLSDGCLVWLKNDKYAGRRACIKNVNGVPGLDQIRVIMESDDSEILVKRTDAVQLSENELIDKPYTGKIPKIESLSETEAVDVTGDDVKEEEESKKKRKNKPEDSHQKQNKRNKPDKEKSSNQSIPWLREGILIRIISKKLGDNYLQKGEVIDVYGGDGSASVKVLSTGNLIDKVKQKHLETVLPSTNGTCIVLKGQHRGQKARLLEKRKSEETCVLELEESLDMVVEKMEDIAAFIS